MFYYLGGGHITHCAGPHVTMSCRLGVPDLGNKCKIFLYRRLFLYNITSPSIKHFHFVFYRIVSHSSCDTRTWGLGYIYIPWTAKVAKLFQPLSIIFWICAFSDFVPSVCAGLFPQFFTNMVFKGRWGLQSKTSGRCQLGLEHTVLWVIERMANSLGWCLLQKIQRIKGTFLLLFVRHRSQVLPGSIISVE